MLEDVGSASCECDSEITSAGINGVPLRTALATCWSCVALVLSHTLNPGSRRQLIVAMCTRTTPPYLWYECVRGQPYVHPFRLLYFKYPIVSPILLSKILLRVSQTILVVPRNLSLNA